MPNLHITEYGKPNLESSNKLVQIPTEPNLASQTKAFTSSTQADNAIAKGTELVCVTLSGDGHIAVGEGAQTADASDRFLAAGQPYYFKATPGHVISAYDGTS